MKKLINILIFAGCFMAALYGQQSNKVKRAIQTWKISDKLTQVLPSVIDTPVYNFHNSDQVNSYSIANAHNGTLGSPIQSKIFTDRTTKTDYLFSLPYDAYFLAPTDIVFYNTTVPYSNITWFSSGGQKNKEDDFKALLTLNANKRLNFSGLIDYVVARGEYSQQATRLFKGGAWGSYMGKWYSATGIAMYQSFNNKENGGIEDPAFISRPDSLTGYEPINIPVQLSDAKSWYKNSYFYFNQKVNFGRGRHAADTLTKDTIKIATLQHTLKLEQAAKRYKATSEDDFYPVIYYDSLSTVDSTRYRSFRNTLALTINEGFSRFFPLGITLYAENDYQDYCTIKDTVPIYNYENDVLIGAEMAKRKGKAFLFYANAELNTLGRKAGDFNVNGGASSSFRLFKDSAFVKVNAYLKHTSPSYFENNYYSNHFSWSNNFDKTLKTYLDAGLGLHNKHLDVSFNVSVQNITNYIYSNNNAVPAQYNGNIQLLTADAIVNLKFGPLYFQNKIVYQQSSNSELLALPEISSYSNLFFGFKLFKNVLNTQLGADVYYHTAYYAPNYMPATGLFYNQQSQLIGNYPVISAYANFHLKTATFFFKYSHMNALFMAPNYFSMPNYPINQDMFRMGITWNFFD